MIVTRVIPIVPLNVVLFPGIPLPLHIFEDRYKEMIQYCIDHEVEFGIVLYDEGTIAQTGCSAAIKSLLKKYDDGRMDILTEGVQRFRVRQVIDKMTYLQAEVEFIPEDQNECVDDDLQEQARQLLKVILKITKPELDFKSVGEMSPEHLSYMIAASMGFTPVEKQALLELDKISERLSRMLENRQTVVERTRIQQLIDNAQFMDGNFSMN